MVFNNKIMKDVVNHRGCKCNLYSKKNNNNKNAKRGSSLKQRYEALEALKNEPDIKSGNAEN